jgi:transcriptional regulator with XRE-family HTH domain
MVGDMTYPEERWQMVGTAIRAALRDRPESQAQFLKAVGVSANKFRELRRGQPGMYRPDTLAKISEGLWGDPTAIRRLLEGDDPPPATKAASAAALSDPRAVISNLTRLDRAVASVAANADVLDGDALASIHEVMDPAIALILNLLGELDWSEVDRLQVNSLFMRLAVNWGMISGRVGALHPSAGLPLIGDHALAAADGSDPATVKPGRRRNRPSPAGGLDD